MLDTCKQIRNHRVQKGLSFEQVAVESGVAVAALQAIERGNFDFFSDTYKAKRNFTSYSKYLGLELPVPEEIKKVVPKVTAANNKTKVKKGIFSEPVTYLNKKAKFASAPRGLFAVVRPIFIVLLCLALLSGLGYLLREKAANLWSKIVVENIKKEPPVMVSIKKPAEIVEETVERKLTPEQRIQAAINKVAGITSPDLTNSVGGSTDTSAMTKEERIQAAIDKIAGAHQAETSLDQWQKNDVVGKFKSGEFLSSEQKAAFYESYAESHQSSSSELDEPNPLFPNKLVPGLTSPLSTAPSMPYQRKSGAGMFLEEYKENWRGLLPSTADDLGRRGG